MRTLVYKSDLPLDLEKAWIFFSSPKNLGLITPPYMDFRIISGNENAIIYPGMIIQYTVKPLFNYSITWVTEIREVRAPYYFIDDQRLGPYKLWHHQHFFRETDSGVEMTDIVNYALPMGVLGNLLDRIWIGYEVDAIFQYRKTRLIELFNH